MDLQAKDGKRIKMICYEAGKCRMCGWSPARNNKNKICQDYRNERVYTDLKPFAYDPNGGRIWRFGKKES